WRNAFFWWIQSVYVSPESRRMGVYNALHDYVAKEARRQGNVCGLRLYVDKDNHIAQGVYSGLSMRPTHYDMYEIEF
ncbi:MAG: GNAT family N-acetyltransferase, partial [Dehalococcoidia bacterium]